MTHGFGEFEREPGWQERPIVPAPVVQQPESEETSEPLVLPRLQVPMPTLQPFTAPVETVTAEGKKVLTIDFLAKYLKAVYQYLVSIAGILAGIMIVWAGVKWLTSAGNPEKIGEAKKKIAGAMVGLVLVLGSYVILKTINPDLVIFKPLRVESVPQIKLELQGDGDMPDEPPAGAPDSISVQPEFTSDRSLAQQNRTATINFSLLGRVDALAWGKRDLKDITLIVVHNGGYTAGGNNRTWLSNFQEIGKKVGAHYTIDRNGVIFQHAGEELYMAHAPNGNKKGIGIELNIGKYQGVSCNSLRNATPATILEACTPTDAQYTSLDILINDIISRTSAQKNINQIVGHCELVPLSGHGDPRAFDWTKIGLDNAAKKQKAQGHPCTGYLPL